MADVSRKGGNRPRVSRGVATGAVSTVSTGSRGEPVVRALTSNKGHSWRGDSCVSSAPVSPGSKPLSFPFTATAAKHGAPF